MKIARTVRSALPRRFWRYWIVIGPFSELIRRMALRLLDTNLRQPDPARTA
jgi:hypothetical protein